MWNFPIPRFDGGLGVWQFFYCKTETCLSANADGQNICDLMIVCKVKQTTLPNILHDLTLPSFLSANIPKGFLLLEENVLLFYQREKT